MWKIKAIVKAELSMHGIEFPCGLTSGWCLDNNSYFAKTSNHKFIFCGALSWGSLQSCLITQSIFQDPSTSRITRWHVSYTWKCGNVEVSICSNETHYPLKLERGWKHLVCKFEIFTEGWQGASCRKLSREIFSLSSLFWRLAPWSKLLS